MSCSKKNGIIFLPHNLGMEVLCLTTCLTMFDNEDSPYPYKAASLFGIINVCLGCFPHDWWWVEVCIFLFKMIKGGGPWFDEGFSQHI